LPEPRFKAGGRDKPRFTIPAGCGIKGDHLRLSVIGLVGLRRHGGNPLPEGQPVKVDVVFEVGKWYATVCYKVDRPPGPEPDMVAAMNRNCGQVAAVYSDGNPRYTGKPQPKVEHTGLKRAQRKQARLKKVSNRRHRTRL